MLKRWIYLFVAFILCVTGISSLDSVHLLAAEEGNTYNLTDDFFEADIDLQINGSTVNGEDMKIRTGDKFTFKMEYILPDDKVFTDKDLFIYPLPKDLNLKSQAPKPIYQPGTTTEVGTFWIEDYTVKITYKADFLKLYQKDSGLMLEGSLNLQESSITDKGMVKIDIPGGIGLIYPLYDGTGFEVNKVIVDDKVKYETDENGNRKAYVDYKISIKSLVDNFDVVILDDYDRRYVDSHNSYYSWSDVSYYYSPPRNSEFQVKTGEVTNLRRQTSTSYIGESSYYYYWIWRADYMAAGSEAEITYRYYLTNASDVSMDDPAVAIKPHQYRNTVTVRGDHSNPIKNNTLIEYAPARIWKSATIDMAKKEIYFTLTAMPGDWDKTKVSDTLGAENSLKFMQIEDDAEVEVYKDGTKSTSITWKELCTGYEISKADASYYQFKYTVKVKELVGGKLPTTLYNDGWFKEWDFKYRWTYDWIRGVYGFRIGKYEILEKNNHEIEWYISFSLQTDLEYPAKLYDSVSTSSYQYILPDSWYMKYKPLNDDTDWADIEGMTDLSSIDAEWLDPEYMNWTEYDGTNKDADGNPLKKISKVSANFPNGIKAGTYRLYVTTKYDYKKLLKYNPSYYSDGMYNYFYNYGYFGMEGYSLYDSDYRSVYYDRVYKYSGTQNLDILTYSIKYSTDNLTYQDKDNSKNYVVDYIKDDRMEFSRAYYIKTENGKNVQVDVQPSTPPAGYPTEGRTYFKMSDLPAVGGGSSGRLYIECKIKDYFDMTSDSSFYNYAYTLIDDIQSPQYSTYITASPYKAIQKVASYTKETAPLVNYTVTLNPSGVPLLPEDTENGYLEVQDTFGSALGFVPSTLAYATKDASGNWSNYSPWTDFETSGQTITIKNVPDKTPMRFQYSCTVKLEPGATLNSENASNAIALKGVAFTNTSSEVAVQSKVLESSVQASANTWEVMICKQNPEKEPIPNTTFEIYSYGSDSNPSATGTLEHTLVTDAKGETETVALHQDKIYRIKEKAPAPGYEGGFDSGYFVRPGKYVPANGYADTIKTYDRYLSYTFMVENEHIKRDLTISKVWNDNNNADGYRNADTSVEIELLADNVPTGEVLTLNEANGWTATFEGINKFDKNVKEISYRVRENNLSENYTESITGSMTQGYEITNTALTKVEGHKTWNDNNNQDGIRPESLKVILNQNGTEYRTLDITEEGNWEYSFTNLPKYDLAGVEYVYTIDEETPEGYVKSQEEDKPWNLINTHVPKTVNIQVNKIWIDHNNQTEIRPKELEIYLLKGIETSQTAIISEDTEWKALFENLPEYENGELIDWSILEAETEGYTQREVKADVTGYEVTEADNNVKEYTLVNYADYLPYIEGVKIWDDNSNIDNLRPESITVNLLANGEKIASTTASKETDWQYRFDKMPAFDAETGEPIEYSIEEEAGDSGKYYEVEYVDLSPMNIKSPKVKGRLIVNHLRSLNETEPMQLPHTKEKKTGVYTYDIVCLMLAALAGMAVLGMIKYKEHHN